MELFEPIRYRIFGCTVRTFCVTKFYICINTSHKLELGVILCPVNLFSLHRVKEELSHSIVMWAARFREGLDNLVHAKQFPVCVGCILWVLVAVKHQLLRLVSLLTFLTKGRGD